MLVILWYRSAASFCAACSESGRAALVAVAYRGAGIGGTAAAAAAAVQAGAGLRARFMIAWAGVTRAPCGRAHLAACARRVGHAASLASIRLSA
jgi:hypothetical protein